jgi:hypothetical protein
VQVRPAAQRLTGDDLSTHTWFQSAADANAVVVQRLFVSKAAA